MSSTPVVDVVVPVHGAAALTSACLASVLGSRVDTTYEIVVVDDASPDPALAGHLDDLARAGRITLVRNETNVGFVVSCDRGMALHPDRDVVLLNSDTLVFDGWLDRLGAAVGSDPTIGTATPFTNNGTLCSYPEAFADNDDVDEGEARLLDELAAEVNAGVVVDVPTGVGFCMYVRRTMLDAIGGFDVVTFGRGYGEENDLCARAAAAGWRNVAATDVVVWHEGSASFGAERHELGAANHVEMLRRWPHHDLFVLAFRTADPLHPARARLDHARLRRACGDGATLVVLHAHGGGTEVFARQIIAAERAAGRPVVVGRPDATDRSTMRLECVDGPATPSLSIPLLGWDPHEIGATFRSLGIRSVRIEQLVGYPEQAPAVLAEAFTSAGIPYLVTLHDLTSVCPRIHAIGGAGTYCGEPGPATCQACVATYGSSWGSVSIPEWRGRYTKLLRGAERVEAPSRHLAERVRSTHAIEVTVRDHPRIPRAGEAAPHSARTALSPVVPGRCRVGVVGRIGEEKGFVHLLDLARHARSHDLPIDLVVIGQTVDDAAFGGLPGVSITGAYLDDHVDDLVRAARLDVVWFPGTAPESWCFALDIALDSGLPIVAFRIGAIAERLTGVERATLLPIGDAFRPARVVDALVDAACVNRYRR